MKRFLAFLLLLLALGGGAYWYFELRPVDIQTVAPHRGTAVQAVYATGEVEPVRWSQIAPQIGGRVISVWVEEGDTVKEDDILVQLDDSVEAAQLNQYVARLDFLTRELERQKQLKARNVASSQKLEQVSSEYSSMKAQVEAQARLIQRMQVTAPMDGVIMKREVEPGETITPQSPVFWVGQPDDLRVNAEVDEEDIPLVETGQKVLIKSDAFPDRPIEAAVGDITPQGDPVNKIFRVWVDLPEGTRLMTGMTVEVNIIIREVEDVLLVPSTSLSGDTVWVLKNGQPVERRVETGIRGDANVEITGGLGEDDRILARPPSTTE